MTSTAQDFSLVAGDTKRLQFTVTDTDNAGAALDLTGSRIDWWLARGNPGRFSPEPVLMKSTVSGNVDVVSSLDGRFDVLLASADTADLAGSFYHEAQVVDVFGNVATVATGTVTISRQLINLV